MARDLDVNDSRVCSWSNLGRRKGHDGQSAELQLNSNLLCEVMQARDRVGMLRLDDFRPVKRLGAGATGCVHLAELKGTRCFFAIKAVDKADLIARDKVGGCPP